MVRAFFVLVWAIVFFCGAAIGLSALLPSAPLETEPAAFMPACSALLLASPVGDAALITTASLLAEEAAVQELREQAAAKKGEAMAPWLVLGTLAVFILGCVGLMPFTGGRIRVSTASSQA